MGSLKVEAFSINMGRSPIFVVLGLPGFVVRYLRKRRG